MDNDIELARRTGPRVAKLKPIFPAIRTLFSLQAFARSPRSKRRRVLYLKLPNNSMSSPDYPDLLGQS